MLVSDNHYAFRKQLLQIHKPGLRDLHLKPSRNELVLEDGLVLVLPQDADKVTFATDLILTSKFGKYEPDASGSVTIPTNTYGMTLKGLGVIDEAGAGVASIAESYL